MKHYNLFATVSCAMALTFALAGCGSDKQVVETTDAPGVTTEALTSAVAETTAAAETTAPEVTFKEIMSSDEDFTIEIRDGNAVVVGFAGDATTVEIPATYEGCNVVEIGDDAFNGFSSITKLVIPDGVKIIGKRAFYSCQGLTEVVIPDSVTTINDLAFSVCMNLSTAVVPDSVTTIGYAPFFACSNVTVKCSKGSAIDEYALGKNIAVEYID